MSNVAQIKLSTLCGSTIRTTDAAVGVDRTYDPVGLIAPGVHKWVDRTSVTVPLHQPSITLGVRPPARGSQVHKVTLKVKLPTPDTVGNAYNGITPGPSVAYTCEANVDFLLPLRSSQAERGFLLNALISLLMTTINASDDVPSDATGTPVRAAVSLLDAPY